MDLEKKKTGLIEEVVGREKLPSNAILVGWTEFDIEHIRRISRQWFAEHRKYNVLIRNCRTYVDDIGREIITNPRRLWTDSLLMTYNL